MSEKTKNTYRWPMVIALLGPFCLFMIAVTILSIHMAKTTPDTGQLVPNALANKPAPVTDLPLLPMQTSRLDQSKERFDTHLFSDQLTLLNFWGSWCAPCRQEHPVLLAIARDKRIKLLGINFKDNSENAQRFLKTFGNPYERIGFDTSGRAAIDWGVYGPPETFLINKKGIIVYKHIGPLTTEIYENEIVPQMLKATDQ